MEITICDNLGAIKFSPSRPFAFTEPGVAMLSSILNSERAISVNIQIIRVFTRMRTVIESHKEILRKLEMLEKKDMELDEKVSLIFEYLKELEQTKQVETDLKQRKRIGFKTNNGSTALCCLGELNEV
jgi:exonuclease I